jgi:integrase
VGLLLYGSGLRLIECLTLRVKDVDLERRELLVRRGKAGKDRVTLIPEAARRPLRDQLDRAKQLHERDSAAGCGWVELPGGLGAKYPAAGKSWPWQWVFPARRTHRDDTTGQVRRHHLHESVIQRAMTEASGRAGSASGRAVIRYDTRSRRICCRLGMTFGPCRSCWGIGTCRRR